MKTDTSLPVRIRARDVRDASRWQLPDMTDVEHERLIALAQRAPVAPVEVEVVEEEIYAEKLTLSQWESLCEEARAEGLAQGREEGLAQGREEGFAQGREEGLAQGQTDVNARLAHLGALIEQLQNPLQRQQDAVEEMLVKLTVQLARAVVTAELATRPELLQQTVAEALAGLPPNAASPRLRLHPDDCALLQEQAQREGWELVEDPTMTRGGCIVEAGACQIDSRVEDRFSQVADQLLARLTPRSDPEGDSES